MATREGGELSKVGVAHSAAAGGAKAAERVTIADVLGP